MSKLSEVTKRYLNTFSCILDQMIDGMTGAQLTDSISHNFIVQMIPHHQAAIDMSRNILQYTTDLNLQSIAAGIIREQTKSIENMRAIEETCAERVNSEASLCRYQQRMDQIMRTMFCDMRGARIDNSVNCDFMWEMIPHHSGAVRMSTNALSYDICPELRPILKSIIVSQKRGIRQMENLLRALNC